MKTAFFSAIFLLISATVYSQPSSTQNAESQVYQNTLSQKVTTMQLDVSGLATKKITDLKTEYSAWNNKVISVNIDFQTMMVYIQHNALWQKEEITEMLTKYGLSAKKIISDN